MKHLGTVRLETQRLILRKAKISDAEDMFKNWASDSRVTKFLIWEPYTNTEDVRGYISFLLENYKNDNYYYWFIELKETQEPIGAISVVQMSEDIESALIGYCLGYNWWHQGIMTEAFTAVIKFLFEEVGINRIESTHDPNNPNSGKVMKKCGLRYEGTLRQSGKNNCGICDSVYYAILKEDYLKDKKYK